MENNYYNRLRKICITKHSRLCIGLDFDLEKMKNNTIKDLASLESFIKDVVDSTIDLCSVFKPNFAFYEKYGPSGMKLLENIVSYINKKSIVIADAKRGDIGNSSKYYAEAIFDHLNFDSITVSPYMGFDSIYPFTSYKDKGVFILALTSNPGSENFQKKIIESEALYKYVINLSNSLNKYDNVGIVVGATNAEYLDEINKISKSLPWLMPGIGAQGGDLKKSITIGEENFLSLVNVSRGILRAGDGSINAIRKETEIYTKEIRKIL